MERARQPASSAARLRPCTIIMCAGGKFRRMKPQNGASTVIKNIIVDVLLARLRRKVMGKIFAMRPERERGCGGGPWVAGIMTSPRPWAAETGAPVRQPQEIFNPVVARLRAF